MNKIIIVIKKDPQVQIKIKDNLDKYMNLPLNYQSKVRYDTLIKKIFLKDLIKIIGSTIVDLDIKVKMKFSRKKYSKSR